MTKTSFEAFGALLYSTVVQIDMIPANAETGFACDHQNGEFP